MFLFAVPTSADPAWVDIAMFWVTCGSVLVSLGIAAIAVWTGRQAKSASNRATQIAKESVDLAKAADTREEARLANEAKLRQDASRREVAFALSQLLESLVVWAETAPGTGTASELPAKTEMRRLKIIAYSKLNLSGFADSSELHKWLNGQLAQISNLARLRTDELKKIDEIATQVRGRLAEWNRGEWTPKDGPEPKSS